MLRRKENRAEGKNPDPLLFLLLLWLTQRYFPVIFEAKLDKYFRKKPNCHIITTPHKAGIITLQFSWQTDSAAETENQGFVRLLFAKKATYGNVNQVVLLVPPGNITKIHNLKKRKTYSSQSTDLQRQQFKIKIVPSQFYMHCGLLRSS